MARILVVDDQKISRLTLAGILGEAGHQLRAEPGGPEGISAAREWLPDIIILDVHMPGMDGFDVVARLKDDPVTRAIPVVFLTGEPPTDDLVVRGLDLGAYDFLSKGCSKAELLARVSVMERIKRGHDELSAIARISDALLKSYEPDALARQFIREARQIFRADAVVLAVERDGRGRTRVSEGLDDVDDDSIVRMIADAGQTLDRDRQAASAILEPDQIERLVAPHVGRHVRSAGVARVRRGPSTAMVVVLAGEEAIYRPEIDGPLLRNLSSQAAIAIEHALLNERNVHQARDLEKAMSERSRFFAALSHELRTPINAVIGYNHLLQEEIFGALNEEQRGALDKANRSAQHLLDLVDDVLDISKIEAGKLELFAEEVDLGGLLHDTATSVQLQASDKGVDLAVHAEPSTVVRTDPARVRQIVLNLLSNAVKFTEEGSVALRLAPADDGVRCTVVDTGPGIPAEDQDRIFEEFEQGTSGYGRAGTGLGLAISRRLAELLGGALTLESSGESGSTFVLHLPREMPDGPADSEPTRD